MTGTTHPLSMGQRSMWNLDRLGGGGPVHTLAWRLRLRGPVDEEALRHAFVAVMARHSPLRTRFSQDTGQPVAIVSGSVEPLVTIDDLRGLPAPAEEAARRCADDVAAGFALDRAPLLRARLMRVDDDRHELLVVVHHIVFDGTSLDLFLDELDEAYRGRLGTRPEAGYADAVAAEEELLAGPRRTALGAFWRDRLAGAPPVVLPPPDRPDPVQHSWVSRTCRRELPDVRRLAQVERCTPYVVYLAALNLLLSRLTGSPDVVVGTPVSSRHSARFEQLVGLFVNTLPMRTQVAECTFRELVRQQRGVVFDALDHGRLPFEALLDEVRPSRATGRAPLFQVLFAMVEPPRKEAIGDLLIEAVEPVDNGRSPFPLTFTVVDDHLQVEYAVALYDDGTANRMAEQLVGVLSRALAEPDRPVRDLAAFVPRVGPAPPAPVGPVVLPGGVDDTVIRAVQAVWSAHLHTDVPDPDADFVALGGHSLLASRIAVDLRELFGLEHDMSDVTVFRAPTPRLLAGHLAAALGEDAAAEAAFVLDLLAMSDEQAEERLAQEERR